LGDLSHFGVLDVTRTYQASLDPPLRSIAPGTYYVVVQTARGPGAPFQFLYGGNTPVSGPGVVTAGPAPPLVISGAPLPTLPVLAGSRVNLSWTVQNTGTQDAAGGWDDSVSLAQVGSTKVIPVGRFHDLDPLPVKQSYTRTVSFDLPHDIQGLYHLA